MVGTRARMHEHEIAAPTGRTQLKSSVCTVNVHASGLLEQGQGLGPKQDATWCSAQLQSVTVCISGGATKPRASSQTRLKLAEPLQPEFNALSALSSQPRCFPSHADRCSFSRGDKVEETRP